MNTKILAGMIAVAGLAAAANAQVGPTGLLEVRIVVDDNLADRPAGMPNYFLPGPSATQVGLTLQARFTSSGTNQNFGISGVSSVSSSALNTLTSNDSVSAGSTTSMQRGAISGTGAEGASMFGAFNPFRQFIGPALTSTNSANWNAMNGNAPAGQNRFPGNAQTTSGANVAAALPGTRTANGFQNQDANNRTQITALFLSTSTTYADNAGSPLPVNGYVPTETPAGTASAWANLYRFMFVPRANAGTDVTRDVTVSFSGIVNYGSRFAFNDSSQSWLLSAVNALGGQVPATASVTFQVPTPGSMALLGLGGLAAFRRRRA